AAAESTFRLGTRFVDGERAAAHLELIQLACRFLRFFIGRHLDKGESACPACRGVAHDANRLHCARPAEQLLQLRLSSRVRKIPDVKPSTHHSLLIRTRPRRGLGARSPNKVAAGRRLRENTNHTEGASRTSRSIDSRRGR